MNISIGTTKAMIKAYRLLRKAIDTKAQRDINKALKETDSAIDLLESEIAELEAEEQFND